MKRLISVFVLFILIFTCSNSISSSSYDEAYEFSEGYAAIKLGTKAGIIDEDAKQVVEAKYQETRSVHNGLAFVKKDGKWGAIDNKGTLVQEPTYKLDDYLKIDFIGRWHYGKDINMNYYNQMEQ